MPSGFVRASNDALGRATEVVGPFGVTLDFHYDAAGNRTLVTDSLGGVLTSTYDSANRLTWRDFGTVGGPQGSVAFGYDAAANVTSAVRYQAGSGSPVLSSAWNYDQAGRVTLVQHGIIGLYTYDYDDASRLTQETIDCVTRGFAYDETNELIDDDSTSVTYDGVGNRSGTGISVTTGNRLESDGTWTYNYDLTGRLARKRSPAFTKHADDTGTSTSLLQSRYIIKKPNGNITDCSKAAYCLFLELGGAEGR